ncbi:MAG: phosphatase PAP2 family protein [Sutterella sp.]|nr:phosphatase PAP2 family protein [Sutterella sp.]
MTGADFSILFAIRSFFEAGTFDTLMLWVTRAGDAGALWLAAGAVLMLCSSTRRLGAAVLLAVVLYAAVGNGILKPLVGRLRPCDVSDAVGLILACPSSYSFPSGHTGASFAAAGVFWLLKSSWRRTVLAAAVLISFSRLYLFVHYPSDVAGGILCGLAAAFIAVRVTALPAVKSRLS